MANKNPTRVRHVSCPVCGAEVPISSVTGRKPLNIPVIFIYDALRSTSSVRAAAEELTRKGYPCSYGYIYKILREQGVTMDGVLTKNLEVKTANAAR